MSLAYQCFLQFLGLCVLVTSQDIDDYRLLSVPQSEDFIQPTYSLYTATSLNSPEVLNHKNTASISDSKFQNDLPTKFIIHGYFDDPLKPNHWAIDMKNELLKRESMNVIVVRWTKGATSINYYQSATNIKTVASVTVQLITRLIELKQASLSNIHLIGHSLGAHTSGLIGGALPGIGRISGLDPAGPGFDNMNKKERLDDSDATFVDAIHTNGKPLLQIGFGFDKPLAHVDYYPDGGKDMPGCKPNIKAALLAVLGGKFVEIIEFVACSHMRAIYLFTESINSDCQFCSYPCKDYATYNRGQCNKCTGSGCSKMGYHADTSPARGIFFLKANAKPDYCINSTC